jgi:hypothetical protein
MFSTRLAQRFTAVMSVALVGGMMLTAPAQAAMVENLTTSSTLFYADFENGTVGSAPGASHPSPGSWTTVTGLIHDFSTTGVNAFEGVKFAGPNNDGNLTSAALTSGSSAGQTIQITFAFYFATGDGFDEHDGIIGQVRIRGNGGSATGDNLFFPEFHHDGSIISNNVTLNQSFNLDAWNTFVFTYTLGSASGTVSVNGGLETVTNTGISSGSLVNIRDQYRNLNFRGRTFPGAFYVDAIPEPASIALIGMGGLLLLRRGRKL